MSSESKELKIELFGQQVAFRGSDEDASFATLPAQFALLQPLLRYAKRDLPRNAVCLDVGANIGLTSIALALACPRGHIYAFEPSPTTYRYLRLNIEKNKLTNITAIPMALGNFIGHVPFNDTKFAAGSHVVERALPIHSGRLTGVQMTTIDRFVREHMGRNDSIDMIKIDVEGFEPGVISGARETVAKFACPVIMELNTWCLEAFHGYDAWAFCQALHRSFDVYASDASGEWVVSGGGAYDMMHRNRVERHCVEDVLLKPKSGVGLPTFAEMTRSDATRESEAEVARLRAKVRRMRRAHLWLGDTLLARANRYLGRLRSA